jgi:hypothetical protein
MKKGIVSNQKPKVGAKVVFTPLATQKELNRTWEETLQVFLQDDLSCIVHRHYLLAKHPLRWCRP